MSHLNTHYSKDLSLDTLRAPPVALYISADNDSGASNPPAHPLSEQWRQLQKPVAELKKDFVRELQTATHGKRHDYDVFADFLEIGAIVMHQSSYNSGEFKRDEHFEKLEADYLQCAKRYSTQELYKINELLNITLAAFDDNYTDFLGEIAGEQNFLSKWGSQFFTPYALSSVAARVSVADAHSTLDRHGFINVHEPAVGGGAMVIAIAESLTGLPGQGPKQPEGDCLRKYRWRTPLSDPPAEYQEFSGINPRSCVRFSCTDVSRNAFNMAYLQLSALGLQAVVTHGDTISGEVFEVRTTPEVKTFDAWLIRKSEEYKTEQRASKMLTAIRILEDGGSLTAESATTPTGATEAIATTGQTEQRGIAAPDPELTNVAEFRVDQETGQGILLTVEDSPSSTEKPKRKRRKKAKGFDSQQGTLL